MWFPHLADLFGFEYVFFVSAINILFPLIQYKPELSNRKFISSTWKWKSQVGANKTEPVGNTIFPESEQNS